MTSMYRADVIGSLLRPTHLIETRGAWEAGSLATPEFKRIEDRAVDEAIGLQEAAGLDLVTDGEMRRFIFTAALTESVDGISRAPAPPMHWRGEKAEENLEFRANALVVDRIRRRRSLAAEEFTYARAKAQKPLKVTLPSPLILAYFWSPEHSPAVYSDPFRLFADAVDLLREEVRELAGLGCQHIQIDAPELGILIDESQRLALKKATGISVERLLGEGIEMINAIPNEPGVTFGLHICRGNNQGRWMSEGGYEAISKKVFERATGFDKFLLEYDDSRSGSFEPLTDVPRDKTVVLGLLSTKKNTVEPAEAIISRIEEASRYFPREQMALSTQCGFASIAIGNPITEAVQEAKLRLVAEVAHRVWT